MKKISFLSFLLLLTIAVILPSCDKDDATVSNSYTFDGDKYELANAFVEEIGDNGNINGVATYDFDLYLTSVGITNDVNNLIGTGDFLYLDLNTTLSTGLESGTYTWSDTRDAFSIVSGTTVYTNYNIDTFEGEIVLATGGTVELEINGDEIIVTVNLETLIGSNVTGTYKGMFKEI